MFTISCNKCSAKAEYNPDKFGGVVDIMFEQGSLNIMDRMIIFCRKCGNKQECGIEWPLNFYNKDLDIDKINKDPLHMMCCDCLCDYGSSNCQGCEYYHKNIGHTARVAPKGIKY